MSTKKIYASATLEPITNDEESVEKKMTKIVLTAFLVRNDSFVEDENRETKKKDVKLKKIHLLYWKHLKNLPVLLRVQVLLHYQLPFLVWLWYYFPLVLLVVLTLTNKILLEIIKGKYNEYRKQCERAQLIINSFDEI